MSRVYFMQSGSRIKIGLSADITQRQRSLATLAPRPIKILGSVRGGRACERRLHAKFKALRTSGEWFRADNSLTEYIKLVAKPHTPEPACSLHLRPFPADLIVSLKVAAATSGVTMREYVTTLLTKVAKGR